MAALLEAASRWLTNSYTLASTMLFPLDYDSSATINHPMNEELIERVRKICLALPDTSEKLSHGEPTWFVRKKVFAMFSNNHHNDGHVAVVAPAPLGVQAALIEAKPKKFYKPPYVGGRGWIGIELARVSDKELAFHLREAWNLIAPPKLRESLDQS